MSNYFALVGLVFAINLLPAFAPPTWAILVFYKLNTGLNTFAIIALGVLASSSGRYVLALATRRLRGRLPVKQLENLEKMRSVLSRRGRGVILYFLFFVISPLPSAQIFEAAALMNAPLVPITLAFMVGRSISYSLSVISASTLKSHAMGPLLLDSLKSPWGIGLQVICLLGIYGLMKIDWFKKARTNPQSN